MKWAAKLVQNNEQILIHVQGGILGYTMKNIWKRVFQKSAFL